MPLPDWVTNSPFAKGPMGIQPPPMMQQPAAYSGMLGEPESIGGMYGRDVGLPTGVLTQTPPTMTAQGFGTPPMPPRRPQPSLDGFMATTAPAGGLGSIPMPPPRPPEFAAPPLEVPQPLYGPGGKWGSYNDSGNPADFVRADHADMVGPGSWLPKDMSKMFDPNSIAGKIMGMANPRPGPGKQAEPQGLLPQLYSGLFGGGSPGPYTGAPIRDDQFR